MCVCVCVFVLCAHAYFEQHRSMPAIAKLLFGGSITETYGSKEGEKKFEAVPQWEKMSKEVRTAASLVKSSLERAVSCTGQKVHEGRHLGICMADTACGRWKPHQVRSNQPDDRGILL